MYQAAFLDPRGRAPLRIPASEKVVCTNEPARSINDFCRGT
jgi:hypothetical protein